MFTITAIYHNPGCFHPGTLYVWALLCARLPGWKVCVLRWRGLMRVLARIWQSASATWGETQGTCALDFAGGSAPRTPGIAQGVALHSCALDFVGSSAPCTPQGASPSAVASANLFSPLSARISALQRWPQCQAGSHTCMHVPALKCPHHAA